MTNQFNVLDRAGGPPTEQLDPAVALPPSAAGNVNIGIPVDTGKVFNGSKVWRRTLRGFSPIENAGPTAVLFSIGTGALLDVRGVFRASGQQHMVIGPATYAAQPTLYKQDSVRGEIYMATGEGSAAFNGEEFGIWVEYTDSNPWRPDLSSLQLWYRPDVLSVGALSAWNDSSPNGSDASVRSLAPTVVAGELNGYAAVQFSGDHDLQTVAIDNVIGEAATIYVVFNWPIAGNEILIAQTNFPPGNGNIRTPWISPAWAGTFYADIGNLAFPGNRLVFGPSPFGGSGYHIMTIRFTISEGEVWDNGTSVLVEPALSIDAPVHSFPFHIGGSGIVNQQLNGFIAEVVIYKTSLDAVTRQKAEGYLAHKFGLQGILPAGHPHKSIAPEP